MNKKITKEDVVKKLIASRNRKREHLVKLEKEMREEYKAQTGMEAKHFLAL